MKKLIVGIALISVGLLARHVWAVSQPQSLGNVTIKLPSFTAAQVAVATATYTGQPIYCSDCGGAGAAGTICISTGSTLLNQFVLSTGTACK